MFLLAHFFQTHVACPAKNSAFTIIFVVGCDLLETQNAVLITRTLTWSVYALSTLTLKT